MAMGNIQAVTMSRTAPLCCAWVMAQSSARALSSGAVYPDNDAMLGG